MKKTLKQARKEGREYINKYRKWSCYISYRKEFGFYHIEGYYTKSHYPCRYIAKDGYEVFILYKNGTLKEVSNTEHSIRFHQERKKRHNTKQNKKR